MRMGQLTGLRALVTGGASGLGAAIAAAFTAEGAAVVVLDMADKAPAGLPDGIGYVQADVTDDAAVRAAVDAAAGRLGGLDLLVNNRRDRRPGQRGRQHRRGVAAGAGRERDRHRPGVPRGLAVPARIRPGGRGQHRLDRGYRGAARPGRLLGQQGRGGCADPGHGGRRDGRRRPGQRREPRHGPTRRGSPGCSAWRPTRPPSGPRWRPASRTAGWSRRTRWPPRSSTWPHPRPGQPPAPSLRWTAGWAGCGCAREADCAPDVAAGLHTPGGAVGQQDAQRRAGCPGPGPLRYRGPGRRVDGA